MVSPPSDLTTILVVLRDAGVEFVVVGGLAAVAQGVPATTFDVDIVHKRTAENVARLMDVLGQVEARARGRPPLPLLVPGAAALMGPGHQLLQTKYGALDVLGAIEGGLTYDDLLDAVVPIAVRGRRILCLRLAKLAELKRGSSRPKDRLLLHLIEAALAESRHDP